MGVEYFLVHRQRRLVLDCHKAYWLANTEEGEHITLEGYLRTFDGIRHKARAHSPRVRFAAESWWRTHCPGDRLEVLSEHSDELWETPWNAVESSGHVRPGWQAWSLFDWAAMGHHGWTPWLGCPDPALLSPESAVLWDRWLDTDPPTE